MNANYLLLLFIAIFGVFCSDTYAMESCTEPGYPDQYPYKNCGGVSPLTWDWSNTTMQVEANGQGSIAIIGGHAPYTWVVNGNGFFFDPDHTLQSMTTGSTVVTLYAQNACGPCKITITDACGTTVFNFIRSDLGQWVYISSNTVVTGLKAVPHTDFEHIYTCIDSNNVWCIMFSSSGPTYAGVGENGKYRVSNWRYHKYYGGSGDYDSCEAAACSSDPPGYGHLNDVPGFPYNWCWYFNPYGNPPFYRCDYIAYRWVQEWQCNQ